MKVAGKMMCGRPACSPRTAPVVWGKREKREVRTWGRTWVRRVRTVTPEE
jgi:hypothetical protein